MVVRKPEVGRGGARRDGRGDVRGSVGDVRRCSSDSGQGVGVSSVVSQSRSGGGDGGRRGRATAGHAGRVMVQRALVVLLVMVVGHVVHGSAGVRARVHAVVMVMPRRRVRVRMVRGAEVRVALVQLLVHLHLRRLGVLGARRSARRRAWQ